MRTRAGFSLAELLIALTLTAVIGVSMMALFVTQSRFLETQQKTEFGRSVSRSATNIIMSELRMVDRDSGIVAASDTSITVRVPYALGIVCASSAAAITFSMLPTDSAMYSGAAIGGYAFRNAAGYYQYRTATTAPVTALNTLCTLPGISVVTGGLAKTITTTTGAAAVVGSPILLWQTVRYHFSASTAVSGRRGLYRAVPDGNLDEEIVAPFDTSARFRFFVNDAEASQVAAPAGLNTLTGIDLILNSVSERPNRQGVYELVPLRTAVFFKNRRS